MKKTLAIFMAIAMLCGVMAVMGYAADSALRYDYTTGYFQVNVDDGTIKYAYDQNDDQAAVQAPWKYDRVYNFDSVKKVNYISMLSNAWINGGKITNPDKATIYYSATEAMTESKDSFEADPRDSLSKVGFKVYTSTFNGIKDGSVTNMVYTFVFDTAVDAKMILIDWDSSSVGNVWGGKSTIIGYAAKPDASIRKGISEGRLSIGIDGESGNIKYSYPYTDNQSAVQSPWIYDRAFILDDAGKVNYISLLTFIWGNWDTADAGKIINFDKAKIYYSATEAWTEPKDSYDSNPIASLTEVGFKATSVPYPSMHDGSVTAQLITYTFDQPVDAKMIVIDWDESNSGGVNPVAQIAIGYNAPASSGGSADTGDMLTISIAVASVAILGTAAAIVMKKRKED